RMAPGPIQATGNKKGPTEVEPLGKSNPHEAGLFDALQLWEHGRYHPLQVTVSAYVLGDHCAASLAPIVDRDAIRCRQYRAPTAAVALQQAIGAGHAFDALPGPLLRRRVNLGNELEHPPTINRLARKRQYPDRAVRPASGISPC